MKFLHLIAVALVCVAAPVYAAGPYHTQTVDGLGDALITADGKPADATRLTQKKHLFIYFSAHWCPPCRAFTPKLVEFYRDNIGKGDFELVFLSSDKSQEAMQEYMTKTGMPWVGVKLGNAKAKELKSKYGVRGIPCLVLLDENDQVLASSFAGQEYLGPDVALRKYLGQN